MAKAKTAAFLVEAYKNPELCDAACEVNLDDIVGDDKDAVYDLARKEAVNQVAQHVWSMHASPNIPLRVTPIEELSARELDFKAMDDVPHVALVTPKPVKPEDDEKKSDKKKEKSPAA